MRLLIVSNTYPPADISGVASLAYEMAHRFGGEGHHVRVLTREAKEPDEYAVAVGGSRKTFPLWAAAELWKRRKEGFDLVHVHESDGFFVVVLWWLCAKVFRCSWARRARLAATLQVSYDKEREMIRPVKADGEEVAWPTKEERSFARGRARIHAFFGRWTVKLADQVIAPSEVTAEELKVDYGAKDPQVVYNGIAVDHELARAAEAHRARLERGEAGQTVIYAGRIRNRKAVAVLLVAFRRVLERCPEARLVLVGDGEQVEALKKLHAELELADRAVFLGQRTRSEVFEALSRADVYCLPSLYEGFPVATLEAMAVGLPVVSTPVSGNPEAVENGVHGLLVPTESATALADALVELLSDEEKRREMGRRGRERVLREFTIETIAARYAELWHNLVPEDTKEDRSKDVP